VVVVVATDVEAREIDRLRRNGNLLTSPEISTFHFRLWLPLR